MHQLFTGQARHHVDQVQVGVVLGDQAQRSAGSFELTVLVVDQQGFLVGDGRFDPGVWSLATKEGIDFGDQGHNVQPHTAGRTGDYTGADHERQWLCLMYIKRRRKARLL
ncbi:hypothetical protein D3C79_762600 [compost metagenome]